MDAESIKKDNRLQNVFDVVSACLFFGLVSLGVIFLVKFFYDYFQ